MATHVTKKETEERKRPLAVFFHDRLPHILYHYTSGKTDRLCIAPSTDGMSFTKVCIEATITGKKPSSLKDCRSFKISSKQTGYFLTYTKHHGDVFKVIAAESKDLKKWKIIDEDSALPQPGFLVPHYRHNDLHVFYYGDYGIKIATSKAFSEWHLGKHIVLSPRSGHFDNCALDVLAVHKEEDGIHLLYDASYTKNKTYYMQIGGAILSATDPEKVLWRSDLPLFAETFPEGTSAKKGTSLGALFLPKKIMIYWMLNGNSLHTLSIPKFSLEEVTKAEKKVSKLALTRHPENPIITPNAENYWESEATFNPATINIGGKIHMLYRSVGSDGVSRIGYAGSVDGMNFYERLDTPAYTPRENFEGAKPADKSLPKLIYSSGGWWDGGGGGCEDPRLTEINGIIYMIYTAFDGWGSLRLALTSIKEDDFKNKIWKWKKAVLISKPNETSKNWVLFPEKINGKFAILHSIAPKIMVEYIDDLNNIKGYIDSPRSGKGPQPGRSTYWDNILRGAGPPPIKTEFGWLLFYHAMDQRDPNRYKIGAMLLDLKDPTKVLYRSKTPILEPDARYENEGKAGVVFSCGAVVKDGQLFVYYGAADKVTAVATAPLDNFLQNLRKDLDVKLKPHPVKI